MKSLATFLKYIIFACLIFCNYQLYAHTEFDDGEYYYGKEGVLDFMPGQKHSVEVMRLDRNGEEYGGVYLRDLKEFKIHKNGKYCLWGSKHWNEECQNVSMEYAYGPDWSEFKKLIIKFIKYIKNEEYDKAISLTERQAVFVEEDNDNNTLDTRKAYQKSNKIYINPEYKGNIRWEEMQKRKGITPEKSRFADEFDITILKKILKDINPNKLKFYIGSFKRYFRYFLMIPYKHENITKYFYITFDGEPPCEEMRPYSLRIEELGIFNDKLNGKR